MSKTGESYTTARRHLLSEGDVPAISGSPSHLPGSIPATTALRVLLHHAKASHRGKALSEPMVFGMAGGIGIGVFEFFYEKEDVATFFLGGRHSWHDDLAYSRALLDDFELKFAVSETLGEKKAEKDLHAALQTGAPVIAWVDAAHLPKRQIGCAWDSGYYHVVTVYSINDETGAALIGDCGDQPIEVPLDILRTARARIKKQKNRVLFIEPANGTALSIIDDAKFKKLIHSGLRRCSDGLHNPAMTWAAANFKLDALERWAERLHGSSSKTSWNNRFKPGPNLWRGLTWIYDSIEHYSGGGGLCRLMMSDFLSEAGESTGDRRLSALAERYKDLGALWSDLAHAALPEEVPQTRRVRELYSKKAEFLSDEAPTEELAGVWKEIESINDDAGENFPMSPAAVDDLLELLKRKVIGIHEAETVALAELDRIIN